jgi:hypothetical protein
VNQQPYRLGRDLRCTIARDMRLPRALALVAGGALAGSILTLVALRGCPPPTEDQHYPHIFVLTHPRQLEQATRGRSYASTSSVEKGPAKPRPANGADYM